MARPHDSPFSVRHAWRDLEREERGGKRGKKKGGQGMRICGELHVLCSRNHLIVRGGKKKGKLVRRGERRGGRKKPPSTLQNRPLRIVAFGPDVVHSAGEKKKKIRQKKEGRGLGAGRQPRQVVGEREGNLGKKREEKARVTT